MRNLKQPWLFVYYAVAFGLLSYVLSQAGLAWAVIAGLGFASLMSGWRIVRQRQHADPSE